MISAAKILVPVVLLLGVGTGVALLVGGGDNSAALDYSNEQGSEDWEGSWFGNDPVDPMELDLDADFGEDEDSLGERIAIAELTDAGIDDDDDKHEFAVKGRVVNRASNPLKNASIKLYGRKSFNWRNFGRRGNGRYQRESRDFRNRRGKYKPLQLGKTLRSDKEGRFLLRGMSFKASIIEVTVEHTNHAPKAQWQEWKAENGIIDLKDIVLEAGGTAIGAVLSEKGGPVAGAKVRFQPLGQGRGRGRYPGPRYPGGGTPRGESNRRLIELIGEVETNAAGLFEIHNLPPGKLRLTALAPKFIPGRSQEIKLRAGQTIQAGNILLTLGAELSGIVRDHEGKPIAGAEIIAELNRGKAEQSLREMLEARGLGGKRRKPGTPITPGAQDELRRLLDQFRGLGSRPRRTKSNTKGEYLLDRLPHASLRVRARHQHFIEEVSDNVHPDKNPVMDVYLEKRLSLGGLIADAATGKPITDFGIRARPIRERDLPESIRAQLVKPTASSSKSRHGFRARNIGRRGNPKQRWENRPRKSKSKPRTQAQQKAMAERQAQKAAQNQQRELRQQRRKAENEGRRRRRDEQRLRRIGGSGIAMRGAPAPSLHPDGRFDLHDLNPGLYVLDIDAKGYRKIAAGPFRLEKGQISPPQSIRLEKGRLISGVVIAAKGGKPIAEAQVELFIPPIEQDQPNFDGNPLAQVLRPRRNGMRVARSTTNKDGGFKFPAQSPGRYRILVTAKGFSSFLDKNLMLTPSSDMPDLAILLRSGGRIYGKVHNMEKGKRITLVLASTTGQRRYAKPDPLTGEYSEEGLDPGEYFVRIQRSRNPMRNILSALSAAGGVRTDVSLHEGKEIRFDVDARSDNLGSVEGRIYVNSAPGANLEISVSALDKNSQVNTGLRGIPGLRRFRGMLGRMLRTRSDKNGKFKIENVPPGQYKLEIKKPGRRGRAARKLHERLVRVVQDSPSIANIGLTLGSMNISVKDAESKKPVRRGRILLALLQEAGNTEPKDWRKLPSFQRLDLRNGKAQLRDVPAGEYVYQLVGKGYKGQRARLFVGIGSIPTESRLQLTKRSPGKKPGND